MKVFFDPSTGRAKQILKGDFPISHKGDVWIGPLTDEERRGLLTGEWIIQNGQPTPTSAALSGAKNRKREEIAGSAAGEILGGFISPSQGGRRFSYDLYDQANFSSAAEGLALDPAAVWDDPINETITWRAHDPTTDAVSYLNLTGAEFIELLREAGAHKKTILQKAWTLHAAVNTATTVQEVEAISW